MNYKIWKWSLLGWLIPALISITFGILILFNLSNNTIIGITIGLIASFGITAICITGFLIEIFLRWRVIKYIHITTSFREVGIIAFRIDPQIKGKNRENAMNFLKDLVIEKDFLTQIRNSYALAEYLIPSGIFAPITFVTLKLIGTVELVYKGKAKRCRGFQRGNWCEVEWHKPHICKSLIEHELQHVILTKMFPKSSEWKQHQIMEEVARIRENKFNSQEQK